MATFLARVSYPPARSRRIDDTLSRSDSVAADLNGLVTERPGARQPASWTSSPTRAAAGGNPAPAPTRTAAATRCRSASPPTPRRSRDSTRPPCAA